MPHCPFAFAVIWGTSPLLAAAAQCGSSQYQASALVVSCEGASGSVPVGLKKAQALSIGSFPAGTRDVSISLTASVDFDMQLIDSELGKCIAGFNCQHQMACASESDYCISYERMPMYFSGDDEQAPVKEQIKIKGVLTRAMDFAVFAQAVGTGTVTYSYGALSSCPDLFPGCAPCKDYMGCWQGQPSCDGTSSVVCQSSTPAPTTLPPTTAPAATTVATTPAPAATTVATTVMAVQATTTAAANPCGAPAPGQPAGASPCGATAPSVASTMAPSVGSAAIAHPAVDDSGVTNRPDFQHGVKEIWRNVSAGTAMVGGFIKRKFKDAVEKAVDKVDQKVSNEINTVKNIYNEDKQKVVHAEQKVVHGYDNTINKIEQEGHKIKHTLDKDGREIRNGMVFHLPAWKHFHFPTFKPDLSFIGKEQATDGAPADRSKHRVPLAVGAWLVSLFQSWNSPGWLCAIALLTMMFVLLSATSFRCVQIGCFRGYAQVTPAAFRAKSREVVFTPRTDSTEGTEATSQLASRAHLLQSLSREVVLTPRHEGPEARSQGQSRVHLLEADPEWNVE